MTDGEACRRAKDAIEELCSVSIGIDDFGHAAIEYHTNVGKLDFKVDKPGSDPDVTFDQLRRRGHSVRNFNPQEVITATQNAEPFTEEVDGDEMLVREKVQGRRFLRWVESGRFEPMLDETHRFFRSIDLDERRYWADANPLVMAWIGVWGWLEDLDWFQRTQERINGVEIHGL